MNFLFGAIIIIIIVLPGFAFRLSYLTRSYKHIFKASFTEEFAFAIIPTLLLQIPIYLFTNAFICDVNEAQLYYILTNSDKVVPTSKSIGLFSLYTVIVILIAILSGIGFKKLSLKYNWHLKYSFLKIYNDWEEYFSGYVLDRRDMPGKSSDVGVVWLDLLIESSKDLYLYSGFLAYFTITPDEKLDRVFLKGVRRKKLEQVSNRESSTKSTPPPTESEGDDANYFMPGDFFIVLGNEIKNINIIYFKVNEVNDGGNATDTQEAEVTKG